MPNGRLFEQPRIYIVILLFTALIFLINWGFFKDETLEKSATVLLILSLISYIAYNSFKSRLRINAVHRNTGTAIVVALIAIAITLVASSAIALFLGFATNWESFLTANSIAMIGAFPPLLILDHKFLTGFIFIILIPTIETITAINIYDLILSTFKSNYTLRDKKVWVGAGVIGGGAIYYHIYAKFIPMTQQLNIHALSIVFVLFVLTCLIAVKMREMEASIYYHWGNNLLAMTRFFR